MSFHNENRRGWRKSVAALAVVVAPIVAVAGFSGNVSAAAFDGDHTALENCSQDGIEVKIKRDGASATYTVQAVNADYTENYPTTIAPSGGGLNSYYLPVFDGTYLVTITRTDVGASGSDFWTGSVAVDCGNIELEDAFSAVPACKEDVAGITVTVPDVKPGNGPKYQIFLDGVSAGSEFADGIPTFVPAIPGTYNVSVEVTGTPIGTTQEVTVSAYICIGEPEDGTVTEICSGEMSPGLNISIPNEKNGNGPKYTLYISADDADVDYDNDEADTNFGDGYDVDYATGEGTFHIIVVGPSDDELYNDYFTVDCSNGGGGNDGWTIDLSYLKPATLPTTGSESNTLLAVAPLMVLLGGALIVARRRLANA